MYVAELRGKLTTKQERMEDILTSNVFSFFKYADREIFLFQFLKSLGLDGNKSDLAEADFRFWPSYEDGTKPDLVITVGTYYLLIEAKFHSGFGQENEKTQHQLVREYNCGLLESHNMDKEFHFIAVTAHYARHQFLAENSAYVHRDLHWLNWHQIALLIDTCVETNPYLAVETKAFAKDLSDLMVKKNLRKYAGIKFLEILQKIGSSSAQLFFEATTALYRGDFLGFTISLLDSPKVQTMTEPIFYEYGIVAEDIPGKRTKKNPITIEKRSSFFDFINLNPLDDLPETIFYQETNHE